MRRAESLASAGTVVLQDWTRRQQAKGQLGFPLLLSFPPDLAVLEELSTTQLERLQRYSVRLTDPVQGHSYRTDMVITVVACRNLQTVILVSNSWLLQRDDSRP
jgi:hypothetical protein